MSLALAYRGLFQYKPAAQAAQRAIDLNPRLPEAYEIRRALYTSPPYGPCARRLDPDLAERLLGKALELDPQSPRRLSPAAHIGWTGRTKIGSNTRLGGSLRNASKERPPRIHARDRRPGSSA